MENNVCSRNICYWKNQSMKLDPQIPGKLELVPFGASPSWGLCWLGSRPSTLCFTWAQYFLGIPVA